MKLLGQPPQNRDYLDEILSVDAIERIQDIVMQLSWCGEVPNSRLLLSAGRMVRWRYGWPII